MKLVYKAPRFNGLFEKIIISIIISVLLVLAVLSFHWFYPLLILVIFFYLYVLLRRVSIYKEKILVYKDINIFGKTEEIEYEACIEFRDDNGPRTWNHFEIEYKVGRKTKSVGLFVPKGEDVVRIIELFKSKGLKINCQQYQDI